MTREHLARLAAVLALTLLAALGAAGVTATPTDTAAIDEDGVAYHPTPTEEPTTTANDSAPDSPPTAGVQPASTRDLLVVVGGLLTGGALVGAGVAAGRWSA